MCEGVRTLGWNRHQEGNREEGEMNFLEMRVLSK